MQAYFAECPRTTLGWINPYEHTSTASLALAHRHGVGFLSGVVCTSAVRTVHITTLWSTHLIFCEPFKILRGFLPTKWGSNQASHGKQEPPVPPPKPLRPDLTGMGAPRLLRRFPSNLWEIIATRYGSPGGPSSR